MKFLPNKLKECREKSNLTQDALLIKLSNNGFKVSRTTLISWENGVTTPPADDLATLASFYSMPIAFFFDQKKERNTLLK